jgi:hypothetical protein
VAKRSAQAGWVGRAQGLGVAASSVAQAPSLRAQERRVATLPCDPHEIAPAHRTFFFFFTARVDARRCTPIHVTPSHDTDAAWSVLPLDSSHLDWWVRSVGGGPAGDAGTPERASRSLHLDYPTQPPSLETDSGTVLAAVLARF